MYNTLASPFEHGGVWVVFVYSLHLLIRKSLSSILGQIVRNLRFNACHGNCSVHFVLLVHAFALAVFGEIIITQHSKERLRVSEFSDFLIGSFRVTWIYSRTALPVLLGYSCISLNLQVWPRLMLLTYSKYFVFDEKLLVVRIKMPFSVGWVLKFTKCFYLVAPVISVIKVINIWLYLRMVENIISWYSKPTIHFCIIFVIVQVLKETKVLSITGICFQICYH